MGGAVRLSVRGASLEKILLPFVPDAIGPLVRRESGSRIAGA